MEEYAFQCWTQVLLQQNVFVHRDLQAPVAAQPQPHAFKIRAWTEATARILMVNMSATVKTPVTLACTVTLRTIAASAQSAVMEGSALVSSFCQWQAKPIFLTLDQPGGFLCECTEGYHGRTCDARIDPKTPRGISVSGLALRKT